MIVSVDMCQPAKANVWQSARRTVAVRGNRGTVQQLDGDTDGCNRPTQPVKADSKVVKTLGTVLCSSCDGVPLKLKK